MTKIETLFTGAKALVVATAANVVTGTQNATETVAETIQTGIPDINDISTGANLITQVLILLVTVWKFFKKDKPKTN